jgi:hypothetical protein
MKLQLKRNAEIIDIKNIAISLNNTIYRISEDIEGRLIINKVSIDGNDDYVKIHPRSGNEIALS